MVAFCHGGNMPASHDYDDDDELTATFPPSQQGARVFAAGKAALAANTTCMRGSNIKILQYRNI